jgi:hypothetical protein
VISECILEKQIERKTILEKELQQNAPRRDRTNNRQQQIKRLG